MTEAGLGPDGQGRPWLSDEQVLVGIQCRPGDEEAVVGFMRALPVEHYVTAQQFFLDPAETLQAIAVSAYEEATGKTAHNSADLAESEEEAVAASIFDPQVGELRGVYVGDIEDSLGFIAYLETLSEMPSREQFEGLCEDHGSYWTMVQGPQTDDALAHQMSYLTRTLHSYRGYEAGEVRIIPRPESVIQTMARIEEYNSPEAKQAREDELFEAIRSLNEWCERHRLPEWMVELIKSS